MVLRVNYGILGEIWCHGRDMVSWMRYGVVGEVWCNG